MRLFFNVPISETPEIRQLLNDLRGMGRGMRTVRPTLLHLTLKFFSEIKEDLAESLKEKLIQVCSEQPPFQIRLERLGVFPHPTSPQVIWMGISPTGPVEELASAFDEACSGPGFEGPKEVFRPHVTVARCQPRMREGVMKIVKEHSESLFAVQQVDTVRLTQSHLNHQPVRYSKFAEGRLGIG